MFGRIESLSCGFNADQPDGRIIDEAGKQPDRVAASADAGDGIIRQPVFMFQNLPARFDEDAAEFFDILEDDCIGFY